MPDKEIDSYGKKDSYNLLEDIYIVGIGASAGGLEAINDFFDTVPPSIDCAFVVIQHLSPDHKSMMPELLSKHTTLPIEVAEDNMFVKPGKVYLLPPRKSMTIRYGKLKLKDKPPTSSTTETIDLFFKSLAEYKKDKAIAIVLSGTGTDGSKGIESVRKAGGLTLVQDPSSSRFNGMPNSAIGTGYADAILSPNEMIEEIETYIQNGGSDKAVNSNLDQKDELLLDEILKITKEYTGNDFSSYKKPTIIRRIVKRIAFKNIDNLSSYKQYLEENPDEANALTKEFLIGVTKFFRDPEAFEFIYQKVIPAIFKSKKPNEQIKVWVAGCSTGEEAYSLAIMFDEYMKLHNLENEIKIFATDIDKYALEKASKGSYSERIRHEMSSKRLKNYFEQTGETYKVIPPIRKMIIFAQHDLINDAPFSKMDFVTCRNLLIYLEPELQKKVFIKFHFSLSLFGYLFIGPSENPGDMSRAFSEINKKYKIYQNTSENKNLNFENFYSSGITIKPFSERLSVSKNVDYSQYPELLTEGLMTLSGYSAVFVNEQLDVVHALGDFKKFIQLTDNKLDFNILRMVSEDLSILLGTAIRKALKTEEWVILNHNIISEGSVSRIIDIAIQPSQDKKKGKIAILFLRERNNTSPEEGLKTTQVNDFKFEEVNLLRHELAESKENLQSLIEELETTNEEMQSSNEELTSSNEELQSTNEELQSLNEELHTVNTEHQLKIKELLELNDDLNNYFRSTDIGQVFIDSNLNIRKFTPAVKQQINLIDTDIGRPISHISNNIRYDKLIENLQEVIKHSITIEREVQVQNGKWFLMKLIPYVKHDKSIDGVVLAFVDIDKIKMLNDHLSGILNSSLNGIMTFAIVRNERNEISDFEWTLVNPQAERILGKSASQLLRKKLTQVMPQVKTNGMMDRYMHVVKSGESLHIEHIYSGDIGQRWLELAAVKLEDGLVLTFADITDKKTAQEKIRIGYNEIKNTQQSLRKLNNELEERVKERTKELSISEERFRLLSLATNDAIWDWDFITNKLWINEGFRTIFGYSEVSTEKGIEFLFEKIHPEDKERVINGIQAVITHGKQIWSAEYRLAKSDGTYSYILDRAYVLRFKDDNMPYRMIGSMVDLSNLKKAQTQLELTNENLLKINNDLDSFIYTASHDLKAPISNIEGLMYTMEDILQSSYVEENHELKNIIKLINLSVSRFKETIKDLTEIAKIQKENMEDLESIDLSDIIEEIKFSIKDVFVKSNAVINYDLTEPNIVFTRKNLKSVMYNLLSNAIKYKSEERDPVIAISSEKNSHYTIVSVTDNGLGIPKDKQNKVFQMFKRMHDHVEGTGIGLYIVKRTMENAGGKVEVESEPEKGSTFRLYFKNPNLKQSKQTES